MLFGRKNASPAVPCADRPSVEVTPERITISYMEARVLPVRHELTAMQMAVLRRTMRRHGLPYTLEHMRRVVELSSFVQLCFTPRSAGLAEWSFEWGIKEFFGRESEALLCDIAGGE